MEPVVNYYLDRTIPESDSEYKTKKLQIYLFLSYLKMNRLKAYTGLRVTQYCWDRQKQQYHTARYKESSPKRLNEELAAMKAAVMDAALQYKGGISRDIIKDKIKEARGVQHNDSERTFFTTFDEFITKSENRERTSSKGTYLSENTIKKYKGTLAHLHKFDQAKSYGINFYNCNGPLIEKLGSYFTNDLEMTDNTVNKYLTCVVTFLNWCQDQEYMKPISKMPTIVKEKTGTIVSLSVGELFHLYSYDFKDTRLGRVRDLFCFQSFTGMAYIDMAGFDNSQIKEGCIYYQRVKTVDAPEVMVPITEWTQSILDRYDELPVISNQKYNDALKDMAKEAGFNNTLKIKRFIGGQVVTEVSPKHEKITSHVGRKTCASVSADLGLERSVTKKILGHSSSEVHDHYRKEQDYIKQRFLEVWSKDNIEKVLKSKIVF